MTPKLPIREIATASPLAERSGELLDQQRQAWPMLRDGYASLKKIETRSFEFDSCVIRVQFNPGRITSSSAKVDPNSIRQRKCFLCPGNLPPEQLGILFEQQYLVLCNPFPILPQHFTIPHIEHTPQRISGTFGAMLRLARELSPRFAVFYNGPRCGASAPDHLHFQAGTRGFMPIEQELPSLVRAGHPLASLAMGQQVQAVAVSDGLRNLIALQSTDPAALGEAFDRFHDTFRRIATADDEPMMNILVMYDEPAWRAIIFPRGAHRPSFFFAEGDERILLSPGAVDFGGLVITALEHDFRRMSKPLLQQMFAETTLGHDDFQRLVTELR